MDVLTRERAKPSLPFGGVFQLIDFPLSSLQHSGVAHVWVSVQYQPGSVDTEIANGRPWDLDRTHGGFRLLVPQEGVGGDEDGLAAGNADVLFRVRDQIRAARPEVVIVMSSDHVYRLDLDDVVARHRSKRASCTIVTTEVDRTEASHHATVVANRQGRVTDFAYKRTRPTTGVVAAEIFVYDPDALISTLEELQAELTHDADSDETGLGDFGEHLLPRMVKRRNVFAYAMPGYWRDVGRPETYFAAHRDLLTDDLGVFGEDGWPILTRTTSGLPPRIRAGADVVDSLISPGCDVHGSVHRSVLGPGVQVAAGAVVSDAIVLADADIRSDASVSWSILDVGVVIGEGAVVGGPPRGNLPGDDELVLIGRDSQVAAGARLAKGARLEPGTT